MGRKMKIYCDDNRPCFAKKVYKNGVVECGCLERESMAMSPFPYATKECPFRKEKKEYTNGVYYPTKHCIGGAAV